MEDKYSSRHEDIQHNPTHNLSTRNTFYQNDGNLFQMNSQNPESDQLCREKGDYSRHTHGPDRVLERNRNSISNMNPMPFPSVSNPYLNPYYNCFNNFPNFNTFQNFPNLGNIQNIPHLANPNLFYNQYNIAQNPQPHPNHPQIAFLPQKQNSRRLMYVNSFCQLDDSPAILPRT